MERLTVETLKELFLDPPRSYPIRISHPDSLCRSKIELQTTDFETKNYITRHLRSYNGSNQINRCDLVFIEEEVNDLFVDQSKDCGAHSPAGKQAQLDVLRGKEAILLIDSCQNKLIGESAQSSNVMFLMKNLCPSNHIGKQLQENLKELIANVQQGNKMESGKKAISFILNALTEMHDNTINKLNMPGKVKDFHFFCKEICKRGDSGRDIIRVLSASLRDIIYLMDYSLYR